MSQKREKISPKNALKQLAYCWGFSVRAGNAMDSEEKLYAAVNIAYMQQTIRYLIWNCDWGVSDEEIQKIIDDNLKD